MRTIYKTEFVPPKGCDPVIWNLVHRIELQDFLDKALGEDAPIVETPSVAELLEKYPDHEVR